MTRAGRAIFLVSWLASSGCSVLVVVGSMPDIDALERLVPGVTTREEAIRAIGLGPYGCGRAQFPDEAEPRDLCYFGRAESSLKDSRSMNLLVFFRDGRYDGYMWFSSLPEAASLASPEGAGGGGSVLNFEADRP